MKQIKKIRQLVNKEEKSLRQAIKETGHAYETIKKYATQQDFNFATLKKQQRQSKLSPYHETINQWLENDLKSKPKQRHTAKRVSERLKEQFEEFDVSERSVRKYVSQKKKELRTKQKEYLPLEHIPAEAQADFGAAEFIENGIKKSGYYLNLSFPYSNAGYFQLFYGENQECLLEGLKNIFEHTRGVPIKIWFDNPSTIVVKIKEYGKRIKTEAFERFELHYGFESTFCNPNSGHEKGSVENKVGYHRRNFLVPLPEFKELETFNKELLEKCDIDQQRKHYCKNNTICELFEKDKLALINLPDKSFEVFRLEKARVDKVGKVKLDNRLYSTSPKHTGQEVWIKAYASKIEILDNQYRFIQSHPRLYGNQKESMKWIPYLELIAKKPAAIKYTGIYKEFPEPIQEYINKCDYQQKKQTLYLLSKMVEKSSINTASMVIDFANERGIKDSDNLWALFHSMNNDSGLVKDIEVNNPKVPELKAFKIDITPYDVLLGR